MTANLPSPQELPAEFLWEQDNKGEPGWYATVHCWDIQEGMFPRANLWNGEKWDWDGPIIAHAGPFETKEAAQEWANKHDPEAP